MWPVSLDPHRDNPETVHQDEADRRERDDQLTVNDGEDLKRFRKESGELWRTREFVRLASA